MLSLLPGETLVAHFWWEEISDKAAHAAAYGLLVFTWLTPYGLIQPRQSLKHKTALLILTFTFVYGTLLEVAQGLFTNRVFDLWDMAANVGGCLVAYLMLFMIQRQLTAKVKQ